MKHIKIFSGKNSRSGIDVLEKEVNHFIKSKNVFDVKFNSTEYLDSEDCYHGSYDVMIIYEVENESN